MRRPSVTQQLAQMLREHAEQDSAILKALGERILKTGEDDERLAKMIEIQTRATTSMESHITADAVAFDALGKQIIEINRDLKAIIATRNFFGGVWKATAIIAGALVTLATLYLMYQQMLKPYPH